MLKNSSSDWYRKMGRVSSGELTFLGGPVFGGYVTTLINPCAFCTNRLTDASTEAANFDPTQL